MAFFGFFRARELVAESKGFSIHVIKLSDIVFKANGSVLEVRIPHSKTDQLGKGTVLSLKHTGAFLCPVCSMQSCLKVRPKVSGQLFIHANLEYVTRYQFNSVLKKALAASGVNATKFASHSFRIGTASHAACRGMDENAIKELGKWDSQSYKSYIRIPTSSMVS